MFAIAKKLNMTQVFTESGKAVPVTVLSVSNAKVAGTKTVERDGYEAVRLQADKVEREFRTNSKIQGKEEAQIELGKDFSAGSFSAGQTVDVVGITKGRGMAGVMKRHGFHGFPASHGHPHQRAAGSIGQAFPQHVRKGVRMAGHMGNVQVTVKSALIVAVDVENNLIFVKGSIPGPTGGLLKVQFTGKEKEALKLSEYGVAEEAEAKADKVEASKESESPDKAEQKDQKPAQEEVKASEDKAAVEAGGDKEEVKKEDKDSKNE